MSHIAVLRQLDALRPVAMNAAGAQTVSGSGFTDVPGGSAWDPATPSGSNFALSNSNKTVTATGGTAMGFIRGTKGISSTTGKYYFEMVINNIYTGNPLTPWLAVGIVSVLSSGSTRVGSASSDAGTQISSSGNVSEVIAGNPGVSSTIANGQSIGFALNFNYSGGSLVGVYAIVNGTWIGGTGGPSSGTPDGTIGNGAATFFPAATFSGPSGTGDQITINTGGPFVYSLPAGYTAWG